MSRKRGTGIAPDEELTEIVKAEIERVDGVLGPANGTPPLLMKSLPDDGRGAEVAEALAKATDDQEGDVEKAAQRTKAQRSDAKFKMRGTDGEVKFPIDDCSDVSDAWGLRGHASGVEGGQEAVERHVRRAASALGCDGPWNDGKVEKADGEEMAPGSPAWEAQDAAALRAAASQLADLRGRVATSRDREAQEDEPYDWENASDLDCAVQALDCALGIVARLAFTEQVEAMRPDDMAKAGRRLSAKTVGAIKTARDHLSTLLGPDGEEPKNTEEDEAVTKQQIAEALREATPELVAELAKALQAGTVSESTSTPEPSGASMESGTGEAAAEEARQDQPAPGHQTVPEEQATPQLAGEPSGGLPAGVPASEGATAAPAGGGMAGAKAAETASDANPALVKSTDTPALDVEALAKSLLEPVMKSVQEAVASATRPLEEGLEAVRKQVGEIAAQPMPGGPLLKGAPGQQFDYLMARREGAPPSVPTGTDADALLKSVEEIKDPVHRQQITRALAVHMHPALRQSAT